MSSALRVFTRGMFVFAEITVVVALVYLLAAIALLNSFALDRANASPASRSPPIVIHTARPTPIGVTQEYQLNLARIFTRWSLRLSFSTRQWQNL